MIDAIEKLIKDLNLFASDIEEIKNRKKKEASTGQKEEISRKSLIKGSKLKSSIKEAKRFQELEQEDPDMAFIEQKLGEMFK